MAMARLENSKLLLKLKAGDLVEFPRNEFYSHWGVYVGDGMLVHLSGEGNDGLDGASGLQHMLSSAGEMYSKARVCKESFLKVAGDTVARINNHHDKDWGSLKPQEIVERALSKIDQVGYNVTSYNCEHFANWCRYDKTISDQVDNVKKGAVIVGVACVAFLVASIFRSEGKTKEKRHQ